MFEFSHSILVVFGHTTLPDVHVLSIHIFIELSGVYVASATTAVSTSICGYTPCCALLNSLFVA